MTSAKPIVTLNEYHPWWVYPSGVQTANPKRNNITSMILNLKNPDRGDVYKQAVHYFSNQLKFYIQSNINKNKPFYVTAVPSSQEGGASQGLLDVLYSVTKEFSSENKSNLLIRTKAIAKLATGGTRDRHVHAGSIEVVNTDFKNNSLVLLIDDITSTGNSLVVCSDKLLQAGANEIMIIALGQTVSY